MLSSHRLCLSKPPNSPIALRRSASHVVIEPVVLPTSPSPFTLGLPLGQQVDFSDSESASDSRTASFSSQQSHTRSPQPARKPIRA
eukprot:m.278202 g.278202  ORF g.278202 m.278202 type:complete len:86 (-) comp59698_c0_seq1:170-427(-)